MMRKAYITGIVALGLTGLGLRATPAIDRLVSSAQTFQRSFHDLKKTGNTLSPIERFVFSLVQATSGATREAQTGTAPERRT